jgi:dTDP-glucose pyrophosphorylase
MKPTLLILAAGMGSRYGGLKQLDPVGPNNEVIMDYSVYDAVKAGFGKVVFVIRRDFETEFKNNIGSKYSGLIDVQYAFQELNDLPDGFSIPEGRVKPWGTSHAILVAKDIINEPFCVINADDFYGREAYVKIAKRLINTDPATTDWSMVGFELKNTLSEFGGVTRGICKTDQNNSLISIQEMFEIVQKGNIATSADIDGNKHELPLNAIASMNFWGFTPVLFKLLGEDFVNFLNEKGSEMKSEFLIPTSVDEYISSGKATMEVLSSSSKWFGVTYAEDKPYVQKSIKELVDKGEYPSPLF